MSKETYEVKDFLDLLSTMEDRLLTYNPVDFVSEGGSNYMFIGRVMRMFEAAHKAVRLKAAYDG